MDFTGLFNSGRVPHKRITGHPECYALIHFGLNTFTDKEWGYGDEDPALFNPVAFNADQIAAACRDGGLEGIIMVCKHHDGFCLWPTKTTSHNITRSPWRDGKGDMVREVVDAARRHGLKMGFYVSPWDRNSPAYGTADYPPFYRQQLREICTNYGPAFELWFDGANGGDGFYGGACTKRKIQSDVYYDWPTTWHLVRELRPEAAIFSDIGPDLRWVGNERGFADPDCFASVTPKPSIPDTSPAPGFCSTIHSPCGEPDGIYYLPPECDVPLRRGWFYHASEDNTLRSLDCLINIYFHSVGAGGYLNIGLAPDKTGQLAPNDVNRLRDFGQAKQQLFQNKLLNKQLQLNSGEAASLALIPDVHANLLEMREDLTVGEKVTSYQLDFLRGGNSVATINGHAIGRRRLRTSANLGAADELRLTIATSDGKPTNLSVAFFSAPEALLSFASCTPKA